MKIAKHVLMGLYDQFFPFINEKVQELNISVTDTCNAKCNMCDIWKNANDIHFSINDAKKIVKSAEFRFVKHIGLTGGEPYLNPNFVDIVETLCELKHLKSISITSHGFNFERITKVLPDILKICESCSVKIICNYSIDGIGEIHDKIRGVPGGFQKTEKSIQFSKKLGIEVVAQCTLQNLNLYNALEINEWSIANEIPCQFRVATEIARLRNAKSVQRIEIDKSKYDFLIDFLKSSEIKRSAKNIRQKIFYFFLAKQLSSSIRYNPCKYQRRGLSIDGRGKCFQCSIAIDKAFTLNEVNERKFISRQSRLKFVKSTCDDCVHDQSGFYSPLHLTEYFIKNANFLIYCVKAVQISLRLMITLALLPFAFVWHMLPTARGNKDRATIIGCYGGEHVGDGAILGGIIGDLSDRSCRSVDILSFRPARTIRWLDSMQLGKDITYRVKPYSVLNVLRSAFTGRELIFGGGPIMDLPYLVSLHGLSVVSHKAFGNRVEFLRVGYGPFRKAIVRWFVDMLFLLANEISVRTKIDLITLKQFCRQKAFQKEDAAFFYLSSHNNSMRTFDCNSPIDASFATRRQIGINLRPLWERYISTNSIDQDLESIELSVIAELAEFVKDFPEYDFELFAMNADTFGMSDFGPLLKLRQLAGTKNIRVIFHEFGVDELSNYIRKFDLIIAMRLHACIFGIANGVNTIGIDYGIGKGSKVYHLFDERGKLDDVFSVETISTEALSNKAALFFKEDLA